MKQETQHDRLSKLGEELLQEFDAVQAPIIPAEFDWKCRKLIGRRNQTGRLLFWVARAAVLAFALVGMLTVAVLSIRGLRTPLIHLAMAHFAPESHLEEQKESLPKYEQISYTTADNTTLSVYCDGKNSYQILWSNEFGQRRYNFLSTDIDEAFIRELESQLADIEE